jgi:hypothetical protein
LVLRQNQILQVRDSSHNRRLDHTDAIPRQQQRSYPRTERKVAEDLDIIVGEIDRVLGSCDTQVLYVRYTVTW